MPPDDQIPPTRQMEFARILADPEVQAAEFKALFDCSPNAVAYCAPDGRFMKVNDEFCRLTGYSSRQLVGRRTWQEITHPDDLVAYTEEAAATAAGTQDEYTITTRYLRPDGYCVPVQVKVTRVHAPPGPFIHFVKQATPIRLAEKNMQMGTDTNGHPVVVPIVPVWDFLTRNWKVAATVALSFLGSATAAINTYYTTRAENASLQAEVQRLKERVETIHPKQ